MLISFYITNISMTKLVKAPKKSASSGSPKKAKKPPSMKEKLKMRKEKPVPTITCQGFQFPPLALEVYEYTVSLTKDGFLNQIRKWTKGETTVDELTDANFVGIKIKRSKDEIGNEPLLDPDGFARIWILRYPLDGESTHESRQEGLRVLKTFFMSKKATDYPPTSITVFDNTTDNVPVLEDYFLDVDIEEIVKASCEPEEINVEFFEKYPDFASKIYVDKEPSMFAKEQLGFPSTLASA
jgi:hypothetical protein